jgi:hypothetical protein
MRWVRCCFVVSTLFLMIGRAVAGQDAVRGSEPALRGVLPLTAAVMTRDLARLRALLNAGHDPSEKDSQGFSPWMWAIHFGENEALNLLLARVPSIPATDLAAGQKLAVAASLNNEVAVRAPKAFPSTRQTWAGRRRFSSRRRTATRAS